MGIINVTPDSFFQGSRVSQVDAILQKAEQMLREGATFLDIGGYSSRPGATDVPVEEEMKRVLTPIRELALSFPGAMLSIDTFRASVAEGAINAGAHMVNDISGGQLDQRMFTTVVEAKVPLIAMHMRGTPQTMKSMTTYQDLMGELILYFSGLIEKAHMIGMKDLIIDPGFGFAKNISQNFHLLSHLDQLHILGKPILVGLSRKSMIYKTLGTEPEEALNGTTVLNTFALERGANILRVHDVKAAHEAITLIEKLKKSTP